jgi:hypothetical protein
VPDGEAVEGAEGGVGAEALDDQAGGLAEGGLDDLPGHLGEDADGEADDQRPVAHLELLQVGVDTALAGGAVAALVLHGLEQAQAVEAGNEAVARRYTCV